MTSSRSPLRCAAFFALVAATSLCLGSTASAQDTLQQRAGSASGSGPFGSSGPKASSIQLGALFGLGGRSAYDRDRSESDYMAPTFGAVVGYEYRLARFFSIGIRGQFSAFQTEPEADNELARNYAISLNVVPKIQYITGGTGTEIYVAVPVGPTYTMPSQDIADAFGALGADIRGAFDYHLSALAGVVLRTERGGPGLFVEGGWMRQGVAYTIELEQSNGGGDSASQDSDDSFSQFALNAGLVFSF